MGDDGRHRLILRVDVRWEGVTSVGYSVEVRPAELVVRVPRALPIGVAVTLEISFARLIEPLSVQGEVIAAHDPYAHERGAGMTIRLLPSPARQRLEAVVAAVTRRSETTGAAATRAVLVVDDSGLVRDMFANGARHYLGGSQAGLRIDVAESGDRAWDLLCGGSYDLAIVDYFMPTMSGADLVARIRGHATFGRLPVVMISTGGAGVHDAAIAAGADLYLDKPIALRDLITTLERLTRRELSA